MSFTTWVRAQDAFGQFDVRKEDDLREGVTLVDGYPEHVGMTARAGKPFVNLGIAGGEGGYKGKSKQELIDEINRRNEFAVIGDEALEVPSKPTVKALVQLLEDHDTAQATAAEAAMQAAGIDPAVEDEPPADDGSDEHTSDAETSGTGEDTSTNETGAPGQESE